MQGLKRRGQLKLVLCGSDDKITITVLGLKSLPKNLCNTNPPTSITLKFAIFPDIEKLIRYKTTPVPVTTTFVDLHESFTFAISRREIHKRLLISAWCKTEEKERRTFIGCMSFGVKNLVNTQEITQGWYYFLSESFGRNRHLKAKINATEYHRRHTSRNRHKMYPKVQKFPQNCEQRNGCDGSCDENSVNENQSNNCELVNIGEEFVCGDDTARYRRRMDKLSKRRRVSFDPALDFKQLKVPVHKQPPSAPILNTQDETVLPVAALKKPLSRGVQSSFCDGSTQKSCMKSPIGRRNVHRKIYNSGDADFFKLSSFKKQEDDVFVDVLRHDSAYDSPPIQLAPIFKVQTKVAKVVIPASSQQKENGTADKLIVRTLQSACVNAKTETALSERITDDTNAYDTGAPHKDAPSEMCRTTKSLSNKSDSRDRGYHSDTCTSVSSRTSDQETTENKKVSTSDDKVLPNSLSKDVEEEKEAIIHKRKNRLSAIVALGDANHDLPEDTKKPLEDAGSETETKMDRTKKSRSSFKHWIQRKSVEERKSKKSSEEKENQLKSKHGSAKRSKLKDENSRSSVDFTAANTLLEVLQSEVGSTAFHKFLQTEYSEENLDFWKECETFKSLKGNKIPKTAVKIYEYYVANGSPKEINIDATTRETVKSRMSNPTQEIFTEAQLMIYKLMSSDSFRRFLKSKFASGATKVTE